MAEDSNFLNDFQEEEGYREENLTAKVTKF